MSDLLFWFLLGQALTGLPQMPPGTEVRLVSRDLVTIYGRAWVEEDKLEFSVPVSPGQELRVLIFPPDVSDSERAEALAGAQALVARVSVDGTDILVQFADMDEPLSLRRWLEEERGIELIMPRPGEGRAP